MKTIDFELFDKWMDEEVYIRPKKKRNEIIRLYKKLVAENKRLNVLEEELEKLGWDEVTITHITDYLITWNKRDAANKRLIKKEEDYKYIKKFASISIKKICEELRIDYSNLIMGRASLYNTKLVRERLEEEIKKLGE